MSNAVDILLVGGPAGDRMILASKERMSKYYAFPYKSGEVSYTLQAWTHPVTGAKYHIGISDDWPVTDEEIAVAIVMGNFGPAWDLNP
jgi:hypothetical protein